MTVSCEGFPLVFSEEGKRRCATHSFARNNFDSVFHSRHFPRDPEFRPRKYAAALELLASIRETDDRIIFTRHKVSVPTRSSGNSSLYIYEILQSASAKWGSAFWKTPGKFIEKTETLEGDLCFRLQFRAIQFS